MIKCVIKGQVLANYDNFYLIRNINDPYIVILAFNKKHYDLADLDIKLFKLIKEDYFYAISEVIDCG